MKEIKIISAYKPRDGSAAGNRIEFFCKALNELNYGLYSTSEELNSVDLPFNVKLMHCRNNEFKGNVVLRFIKETIYCFKLIKFARINNGDVIFFSIPHMSFSFFIRIIKFFFSGVKIVVDVRDLTWLYINKNDKFFEKLISRTFEKICLFNIARADVVFVTNGYQKKYISSFNHNVITIQNGISREKHKILSNVNGGGITVDCIKILYAGNFGLLQNLFTILEAVRAFNCTQYQLYLVGNGADKDRIKNYVNQHRLNDRVFIFDSVSFGELVKFYEQCDIVYGQIINTKALKTAVPSKVFEYASLGKPIIYGIRGAGEDEIKKLAGVFVVEPENVLALSAVLEELLDSSLFARVVNEALSNVDYSSSNFVRENYESVCRETIVRLIND